MTEEELLSLNRRGFIPGPDETEGDFLARVDWVRKNLLDLGSEAVSPSHWNWVRVHLKELFDFAPECIPAFYSNRSLAPWQGAASWVEGGRLVSVQLREALRAGSYLGIYRREEILSHEAVHAARAAFSEDRWEEHFAWMSSENGWRRALGPIVRRPWEAWPFVLGCFAGALFPIGFLAAAVWAGIGFGRLVRDRSILRKASRNILNEVGEARIARAILVRLTDREIEQVARGEAVGDSTLRWRLIRAAYWKEKYGTENRR
jgi:hypothetical protein